MSQSAGSAAGGGTGARAEPQGATSSSVVVLATQKAPTKNSQSSGRVESLTASMLVLDAHMRVHLAVQRAERVRGCT